jgi:hypothetical protein
LLYENETKMRRIRTMYHIPIKDFQEPHLHITEKLLDELFLTIDYNKNIIFYSVGSIERMLDRIISHYFYGPFSEQNKDFIDKFNSLILSSDWCSFSSKRKLVLKIVNELNLLEGKYKDGYEKLLRNVMSIRNALTHGELSTDGRIVMLKYYEGESKEIIMDEAYFQIAETKVNSCLNLTLEIARALNITKENKSAPN